MSARRSRRTRMSGFRSAEANRHSRAPPTRRRPRGTVWRRAEPLEGAEEARPRAFVIIFATPKRTRTVLRWPSEAEKRRPGPTRDQPQGQTPGAKYFHPGSTDRRRRPESARALRGAHSLAGTKDPRPQRTFAVCLTRG